MQRAQIRLLAGSPVLFWILVWTLAPIASAQVYKSIDADGNVVYSSSPPATAIPDTVEAVRIDPGPSEADVSAAERRWRGAPQPGGAGTQQAPPAPGADAQPEPPQQAAAKKPPIDWKQDEAVLRAGQTNRVQRGSGGLGRDGSRGGGSISSGRTSR